MKQLSLLPAAILMIIIFLFSSKSAVLSNESSLTIVSEIIKIYENMSNVQYQGDEKVRIENNLNHIVRKSAHFCEYALLAITFALHLYVRRFKGKRLYFLPIFFVFLYAITDEFHQLFVPGRAGLFTDVLLDTSGGAVGSLIFTLIILVINVKKNTKITAKD